MSIPSERVVSRTGVLPNPLAGKMVTQLEIRELSQCPRKLKRRGAT